MLAWALALVAVIGWQVWPKAPRASQSVRVAPPIDLTPPPVPEQRLLDITPEDARAINARQAFVARAVEPASPFVFGGPVDSRVRAIDCLAAATWYEAGDDAVGQRSVAQVVVNRALNPAFPATICGVVFQGAERRTGCQFTFACDGALRRTPSQAAWIRARAIATAALSGEVDRTVGYATHYHTDWVVPYWRSSLDKIAQVRTHLFYRWRGYWGTPSAFAARRSIAMIEPTVPLLARLSRAHTGTSGLMLNLPPIEGEPGASPSASPSGGPPPPPIVVENVAEKSLRGAIVRGRSEASDTYFIEVSPTAFTGAYATAAVALCKGRATCKVLGWRDAGAMATSTRLSAAQGAALTFLYLRTDPTKDVALWNCEQVERANKAQCLPPGADALARLLNDQ